MKLLVVLALLLTGAVGCGEAIKPTEPQHAPKQTRPSHNVSSPKITPAHKPKPTPNSKMFKSCVEAFDKRHVPVYKWEPEYNPKLDGDHDGMACEHED